MAADFALPLQAAIRAALVADAGVAALVAARIYDEPPSGVTFPYVRFGDIVTDAFDTDSTEGALVQVGLVVHSNSASGRVEAAQIVGAIKTALHRQETAVTVAGFTLVELIFQTYSTTRNSEGRGYTAIVSMRAMLEE